MKQCDRRAAQRARVTARLSKPIRLRPHVALRPRRCEVCDGPVLLDLDDTVLNNDGITIHRDN